MSGAAGPHAKLVEPVVAHYERALERHGPSARGMDWKDDASQRLRFDVLAGVCDLGGRSVHDVGCGVGHFRDHLRARGIDVDYSGSDLSEAMIAAAHRRDPELRVARRDVLAGTASAEYDVVVTSGLFHVKLATPESAWAEFVRAMLRRMFSLCRVAIAFNLMSDRVDFRNDDLFYADPSELLDFCLRELSRRVVVRHDYPLYEFTTYVYRDPADA